MPLNEPTIRKERELQLEQRIIQLEEIRNKTRALLQQMSRAARSSVAPREYSFAEKSQDRIMKAIQENARQLDAARAELQALKQEGFRIRYASQMAIPLAILGVVILLGIFIFTFQPTITGLSIGADNTIAIIEEVLEDNSAPDISPSDKAILPIGETTGDEEGSNDSPPVEESPPATVVPIPPPEEVEIIEHIEEPTAVESSVGVTSSSLAYCDFTITACQGNHTSWVNHSTYCLGASIANQVGTCMHFNTTVQFTNITLDCQGFTIDGDDTGSDYGVIASSDGAIAVKNCNISDFFWGFYVLSSDNSSSLNNTFFSNADVGIELSSSNNATINNSLFSANLNFGIEGVTSNSAIVLNNTFIGQNGTNDAAISFAATSTGSNFWNISYNNFSYNTRGIIINALVSRNANNTIFKNLFFRNKAGAAGSGIYVLSDLNSIIENYFFENFASISIDNTAEDNIIRENHINTSIDSAFNFVTWDSTDQTINNNLVEGQTYYHCYNNDSWSLSHLYFNAQNASNFGGINTFGCDNMALTNVTVTNNFGGSASTEGLGIVIYNGTNVTIISSNFSWNNNGGIIGSSASILGVVRNSSVSHSFFSDNSFDGLLVQGSGNLSIINNSIDRDGTEGLTLDTAHNITVRNNDLSSNGNDGIYAIDSDGAIIFNNTILSQSGSLDEGIILDNVGTGCDYWNISYNNFSYNNRDLLIDTIASRNANNSIFRNFFYQASTRGLYILSDENVVIDNTFIESTVGISIDTTAENNLIRDNKINDSSDSAIEFIDWNALDQTFNDNLVNGQTYYHCYNNDSWSLSNVYFDDQNISNFGGINIFGCDHITLTNVTVTNNTGGTTATSEGFGLAVINATNVTITLSNFSKNNLGVIFGDTGSAQSAVSNSSITHSFISDNTGNDGLQVRRSPNITVINTTFNANQGDGIDLDRANNFTLRSSSFFNNTLTGLVILSSHGSAVLNNTFLGQNFSGTTSRGITFDNSGNASFWNVSYNNFSYNSIGVEIQSRTGSVNDGMLNNFFNRNLFFHNRGLASVGGGASIGNDNNTFVENEFTDNFRNVDFTTANPENSLFFRNNFFNISGGLAQWHANTTNTTNKFNISTAGNYWSDYDTSADGCNDANNNGFCDAAYTKIGGSNDSLPYASMINFGNDPPNTTLTLINSTPLGNFSISNFTCYANVSDAQGGTVFVNYTWYNNSELIPSLTGQASGVQVNNITLISTILAANTTVGQTWICSVRAFDGLDDELDWNNISVSVLSIPDTTPPNVTLLIPAQNTVFNHSMAIEIAVNVSDNQSGISFVFANVTLLSNLSTYTLTLTNGTNYNTKFNISYTIPNSTGIYNISFFANDTRNNINNTERTNITVIDPDFTAPNVTQLVPILNSVFNHSMSIEIATNVTDNESGISVVFANVTILSNLSTYTLTLVNSTGNNNKFNISYIIPNSTGVYNVTFFANDTVNLINNTERTNFTVILPDIAPPNMTILAPPLNSRFNYSMPIEIAVNVSENQTSASIVLANITLLSNLSTYTLTLTNGTNYKTRFNTSYAVPNSTGVYNITFFANDTSNNINNTERTNFTVQDLFPPNVTAILPATGSAFTAGEIIEIAANVSDGIKTDAVLVNISYPNNSVTQSVLALATGSKYNLSFTLPQSVAGAYTLIFTANDSSNNINSTERTSLTTTIVATGGISGDGGGSSGGGGSAPSRSPEENVFFNVNNKVFASIAQGQAKDLPIEISNTGKGSIVFSLELRGLDFASLREGEIELLPGEIQKIHLQLLTQADTEPGVYTGKVILTGVVETIISVLVTVTETKAPLEINLETAPEYKTIIAGKDIVVAIDLKSTLGLERLSASPEAALEISLADYDQNVLSTTSEIINLNDPESIVRTISVPPDLLPGDYLLLVKVVYQDHLAESYISFTVQAAQKELTPEELQPPEKAFPLSLPFSLGEISIPRFSLAKPLAYLKAHSTTIMVIGSVMFVVAILVLPILWAIRTTLRNRVKNKVVLTKAIYSTKNKKESKKK